MEDRLPEEWLRALGEIQEAITDLPPEGYRRLSAPWKQVQAPGGRRTGQYTPLDPLRDLLIRLSETWPSFCTFYADPAIPWTKKTPCFESLLGWAMGVEPTTT